MDPIYTEKLDSKEVSETPAFFFFFKACLLRVKAREGKFYGMDKL